MSFPESTISDGSARQRLSLPQEILDNIIDYQHADLDVLRKIALASHSFLYSARYHIFYSVTVSLADRQANRYASFTELLKGGGPSISHAVRSLTLKDTTTQTFPVISVPMLVAVITELPRLCELFLFGVTISCDPLPSPFPSRFHIELQQLQLNACFSDSLSWRPILEVIDLFTSIDTLDLIALCADPAPNPTPLESNLDEYPERNPRQQVQWLTLCGATPNTLPKSLFVNGLMNLIDVVQLESLQVSYDFRLQEPNALLLERVLPTLKSLQIQAMILSAYEDHNIMTRHTAAIDLSSSKVLEDISPSFTFDKDNTLVKPSFHVFDTLATLPCLSSLSEFTCIIQYICRKVDQDDIVGFSEALTAMAQNTEWQRLGILLGRLTALKSVAFMIGHHFDPEWTVPDTIQELLRTSLGEVGDRCEMIFSAHFSSAGVLWVE